MCQGKMKTGLTGRHSTGSKTVKRHSKEVYSDSSTTEYHAKTFEAKLRYCGQRLSSVNLSKAVMSIRCTVCARIDIHIFLLRTPQIC